MTPNIAIKAVLAFHDGTPEHAIPEVIIKEVGKRHRRLVTAGMATASESPQIQAIAWDEADAVAETSPMVALSLSVLDELTAAERAYGRVDTTNIVVMDIPLSAMATAVLATKLLDLDAMLAQLDGTVAEWVDYVGLTVIVRQLIPDPSDAIVLHEELFRTSWNYIGPCGVLLDYKELEGAE